MSRNRAASSRSVLSFAGVQFRYSTYSSPAPSRSLLAAFERDGRLARIAEPVSPRFQLSAMLAAGDRGPALLFESVQSWVE